MRLEQRVSLLAFCPKPLTMTESNAREGWLCLTHAFLRQGLLGGEDVLPAAVDVVGSLEGWRHGCSLPGGLLAHSCRGVWSTFSTGGSADESAGL